MATEAYWSCSRQTRHRHYGFYESEAGSVDCSRSAVFKTVFGAYLCLFLAIPPVCAARKAHECSSARWRVLGSSPEQGAYLLILRRFYL